MYNSHDMKSSSSEAFWVSLSPEIFLNPRLPAAETELYRTAWQQEIKRRVQAGDARLENIALATSGSSGRRKLVLLKRSAILRSADTVNKWIQASKQDRWLKILPDFHIGGLAMKARAILNGASLVDLSTQPDWRWSADVFTKALENERATLCSLVPTQVFDLVQNRLVAPKSLRCVFVGGGRLSLDLYRHARRLGWPLLPTYGLTECASQVASAQLMSLDGRADDATLPALVPLPHVQLKTTATSNLMIRSESLLDGYLWISPKHSWYEDPKSNSWLETEDRGELLPTGELKVLGRDAEFIKIGGESVDLARLDAELENSRLQLISQDDLSTPPIDMALFAAPDERLGHVVHLSYAPDNELSASFSKLVVDEFNRRVAPFERIRAVHARASLSRTAIGKIIRNA